MERKIIKIDKNLCNGCGLCAAACHEGAIGMVEGKAVLLRDDYCDGLGNCLPVCPTGAISFEVREAAAFDEAAVNAGKKTAESAPMPCGCPGSAARGFFPGPGSCCSGEKTSGGPSAGSGSSASQLRQWPVQIKLAPIKHPTSTAPTCWSQRLLSVAYGDFHNKFIRNRVTLIGCPKLDEGDYSEKLTEIIRQNDIKSVTIVRMEVPCCGGLEYAAKKALQDSGKFIPWQVVTISAEGEILE